MKGGIYMAICSYCGKTVTDTVRNCPYCGRSIGNHTQKWTVFFLCLFLGEFGAHKFYEKKVGMGILYLLTAGLFGIGILVDLCRILIVPERYFTEND